MFYRLCGYRQSRRGSSLVEYSLLLAVVSAGILVGVQALQTGVQGALDPLATSSHVAGAGSIGTEGTGDPFSHDTISVAQTSDWQLLFTQGVALTASSGLWFAVRGKRKQRQQFEAVVGPIKDAPRFEQKLLFEKRQLIYRILSEQMATLLTGRLEIRHVMSTNPSQVLPQAPIDQILATMRKIEARHILVCDEQNKLVGIISDRDLRKPEGSTARELMTPQPITVGPTDPLSPAITQMVNHSISCLPVINEQGQATGILTSADLLLTLQCALQLLGRLVDEVGAPPSATA